MYPTRSPVLLPRRGLPPPRFVVVERRQIVVDERERMHELERAACGQRELRVGSGSFRGREDDHRPHALAADRDRVPHRLGLPVQVRPELEPFEGLLDEAAQLLGASGHPLPPTASRARAPPRPTSRARTARSGSRARDQANRLPARRAGRARRAPPRAAPAIPPPSTTIPPCSCR